MNKLKKMLALTIASALALSMTACSSGDSGTTTSTTPSTSNSASESTETSTETTETDTADSTDSADAPESIKISAKNGEGEFIDMEVPYFPEKVVFMDYVAFDMALSLDILDEIDYITVKGDQSMPQYLVDEFVKTDVTLEGLKAYQESDEIKATIYEFEPNLVFTSGRSASDYDLFMDMTVPDENGQQGVVSSSITYQPSTYESFKEINIRNASIFGKDDEMADLIAKYDDRMEALSTWGEGKTAVAAIFTGGAMNLLGSDSRCSMIFNDLGFENVGTDEDSAHGDISSYEVLLLENPDYIFILDRDVAIGAEGATGAMELLDNEIVQQTDAWQNGNIVVLDPLIWYLVEGGITAMDTMLSDLETGMNG